MSTADFIGSGFSVESARQYAPATIIVKFTQDPLATDPSDIHDALYAANYTVSGPAGNHILNCGSVVGDTQSIYLFMAAPLAEGLWGVTVNSEVETTDFLGLEAPFSAVFNATAAPSTNPVHPGAQDDDAESILRKYLNPYIKGPGTDALLAGLAVGEQQNYDDAESAFDQLFKSSAAGKYLTQRAADDGVPRPTDVGMPDLLFSRYAIFTTAEKLTEYSLLELLEIFYGQDSVRAFAQSGLSQPYAINDGDQLLLLIDEKFPLTVTFHSADFAIPGNVSAIEIAVAINRSFEANSLSAFAIPYLNPLNGLTTVRIYSGAIGLASAVRILGGDVQNQLQFPTLLPIIINPLPSWAVTYNAVTQLATIQASAQPTSVDLSQLQIGDYVTIYGAGFAANNRGTFTVVNVYFAYPGGVKTQYFQIANPAATNQTVAETAFTDLLFWRPTKQTPYTNNGGRNVIVAQPGEEVDIIIPATSQAVGRAPYKGGAYLNTNAPIPISALERINGVVTVTATAHGLVQGSQILVEGVMGNLGLPPITFGTNPTGDSSKRSIWSNTRGETPNVVPTMPYGHHLIKRTDGSVVWTGGEWVNHVSGPTNLNHALTAIGGFTVNSWVVNPDSTITFTWGLSTVANWGTALANTASSLSNDAVIATYAENVIITGGWDIFSSIKNTTQMLAGTTLSSLPTMSIARAGHRQTTLNNGKILVTGGMSAFNEAVNSTELLTLTASPSWSAGPTMNFARADHEQLLLGNGHVLVVGGRPLSSYQSLLQNPATVAFYSLDADHSYGGGNTGTLDLTSNAQNMLYIPDSPAGTMGCVAWGESGNGLFIETNHPYGEVSHSGPVVVDTTPILNALKSTGGVASFTVDFWVQGHPIGPVLEVGTGTQDGTTATNILFGFGGSFVDGGNGDLLKIYWQHATNTLISNSCTIGAIGGVNSLFEWNYYSVVVQPSQTVSTVDILLYVNGTLRHTFLAQASSNTTATGTTTNLYVFRSPTGILTGTPVFGLDNLRISSTNYSPTQVFLDYQATGGELDYGVFTTQGPDSNASFTEAFIRQRIGVAHNSCEIYNGSTWNVTGPMGSARVFHKAILLPDGRVVAIGGVGYDPSQPQAGCQPLKTAEIWDPASGRWSPCGSMRYARDSVVAEYLAATNEIVVTGGSISTSTEILDIETLTWRMGVAVLPHKCHRAKSIVMNNGEILLLGGIDTDNNNLTVAQPFVYVPNADTFISGGLNGPQSVASVIDANTFTYDTAEPAYTAATSGSIIPVGAQKAVIPGPIVWDPAQGLAITSVKAVLTSGINIGHQYNILNVDSTANFPAQGWVVLNFGYANQVGPVRYLSILSETELALDYSFKFPQSATAGSVVILLLSKGPFIPTSAQAFGVNSLYLTDSPAGRIAAQNALNNSVAAGLDVNITVVYPGDRGLGAAGYPTTGTGKLSDIVECFSSPEDE